MSQDLLSSDEDYAPRINVPSVNLAHHRKKDRTKANFSKAKKKFTGAKLVRFPDRDVRNSFVSNSSNLPSSEDEQPAGLPSFLYDPNASTYYESDSDSTSNPGPFLRSSLYHTDSSDAEHDETDITDIRRVGLHHLLFHHDMPSRSDTFLGRVLNFGAGAGLSGGGLTPGASRAGNRVEDEESMAGGLPEDYAMEMRNLNFADLNDEAQKLIRMHAPELEGAQRMSESNPESEAKKERRGSLRYTQDIDDRDHRDSGSSRSRDSRGDRDYARDRHEDRDGNRDEDRDSGNGSERRHSSGTHSLRHDSPMKEKTDDIATSEFTPSENTDPFYQPNPNLLRTDLDHLHDEDFLPEDGYVAPPKHVHAGVLLSLLKLYQQPQNKSTTTFSTDKSDLKSFNYNDSYSNDDHGFSNDDADRQFWRPKRIAERFRTKLPVESDLELAGETLDGEAAQLPSFQNARPRQPREKIKLGKKLKKRQAQKLRITVHIADILQRQRFIIRMCRALMMYGAPTHRLEEYMVMTSRVLEIDGQFVYFPGTMLVAFGDAATRTSEVHLVRCAQGVNLSKLSDTHKIYKEVIHDLEGVEGASQKLEKLMARPDKFLPWMCVFIYGLGSASVCTWGFGGGWLDIPVSFGVGLFVGYLQFFVSSMSHLYLSVFEVTASIVVSFSARGIGSIKGGNLFCFGAIAQGSLALILPGYIILCGSLELQSKNLVAGSVRMFYAIIYSLFLGFGITLGAALYGWVDKNATDAAQCSASHSIDDKWRILFVPLFSLCLGLINQARWRQTPIMILILSIAYIGTYFAGKHFANVTEFTATIGAFIIGILGNMYSRLGKGMAVAAMLPAIFVQVPSGIASKGSLLAGVNTANKITNSSSSSHDVTDVSSLSFGATMVEVSIGISVGLFAAAIVVYPFGKRRTSLFTL